jgi:peptidoglycan hydrolase-like protein with peptidoglycan-binding domain
MKKHTFALSSTLAAALAFGPATPVRADAGDAIAGALVGGIIGHAIAKDQQRRKTYVAPSRSSKSTRSSGISSAQREANREVQTALNYFGYNVGTPDGAIGPRSRSGISSYQATLGYPPTGQLTEYERTILVTAYHRAVAGGPQVMQVIGTHPMGTKGLLIVQRDEMAGVPSQPVVSTAGSMAATTAPAAPAPATPAAALPALVAEPEPEAPATTLPVFGGTQVSLSSHCNQVALRTSANGGYATLASMSDPSQALSEQFCLLRAAAIQQGEELSRGVSGVTPAQMTEQCKAYGPVLKDHVTAVSLQPAADVIAGVAQFIAQSGMSPAQLSGTSKICLGVGYAVDDPNVAIGSALVLTALGEAGYAAVPGHHLADGIGATRRPDLSMQWFELSGGVAAMPGSTAAQAELVHKAIFMLNGRSDAPAEPAAPVAVPATETASTLVEATPAPTPAPTAAATVEVAAPSASAAPEAQPVAAQAVSVMTALPRLMLGN